jgi:hypothetical protein
MTYGIVEGRKAIVYSMYCTDFQMKWCWHSQVLTGFAPYNGQVSTLHLPLPYDTFFKMLW